MPTAAPLRSVRRTLGGLLVAVAGAAVLLPATATGAGAADGTVVVGELLQAWPEERHAPEAGHGHEAEREAEHGHEAEHEAEGPLSWVRAADGTTVRVETEGLGDAPPGSTVAVSVGAEQADEASADGYEAVRPVLDAELRSTPGPAPVLRSPEGLTNQVTVALVAPEGTAPDDTELADLVATVDGPVADFWAGQSDGALAVGVTAAHDWIATEAPCADPNELWAEVADAVGFTAGPGRHLLVYVSSAPQELAGCSYALAQVGTGPGSGGSLYVRDDLPSVIAHELGHNFGLGHSSGQQCVDALETGDCRTEAYRDFYDVMGASWAELGSLNAAQASHLGLLPAGTHQAMTAGGPGGAVTLAPLSERSGVRALRLTDAAGTDYWLEYRAPSRQDAWLGTAANVYRLDQGVLLRRAGELPDTSVLLDGTPGGARADDLQTALPPGRPVSVAGGAFTVVVDAVSPAGATVRVETTPAVAPVPVPAADGAAVDVMPAQGTGGTSAGTTAQEPIGRVDAAGAPVAVTAAVSALPVAAPQPSAVVPSASVAPFGVPVVALAVTAGLLLVAFGLRCAWVRRLPARRARG